MLDFFSSRFGSGGFLNEKLWLGHLGHFFIVFSFFGSLLAVVSYFTAEFSADEAKKASWRKLGRVSYIAHGSAILGIFILLFIMILNHMFEYHYAWRHSSTELPLKYIISSFWEGQEGSFLLWQFWLAVLGIVGIFTLRNYENPVMGITALTQVFLGSMVLGVYILGHKIGSNPFVLLRDEMAGAPIFQRPNYLQLIQDGNGLNPLLQNYWMTIHPPVLFCGFASVTIPFAFAISSLLRKDWDGWVKPAMPWTLFSVAVLGTGILMGGAWAYESLSFGGFWAWDPVENMSFVPWLMVVAGLHMLLVYRYTKHSLISTYVFFILAFSFVLYSTFLTRSGILGDTSVHAFTDLGMTGQLLLYMFFFLVMAFTLLFIRIIKKQIPVIQKEEEFKSREFWMFIGTLVLLLSAVQMTFTTSIPVWNIVLENVFKSLKMQKLAPPVDVVSHYNSIQIFLGIFAGLLTGLIQFLAYRIGRVPATAKWAVYSFGLAILVAVVITLTTDLPFVQQHLIENPVFIKFPFISSYFMFLVSALFAVFANLAYLIFVVKGNSKLLGGTVSHFGFGLFLLGVLISQGEKKVISINKSDINFGKEFKENEKMENILLLKDSSLVMGDYRVTYIGTREEKPNHFYEVKYERKDSASGKVKEEFVLLPNAQLNPKMGLIANPDTKHYLTKDVFTHVSSVPDNSNLKDTTLLANVGVGDSFFTKTSLVIVEALNPNPVLPEGYDKNGKLMVGVDLKVSDSKSKTYKAQPVFIIDMANGNSFNSIPAEVKEQGLTIDVTGIDPNTKKLSLSIRETEKPIDFIIMKAIVFPYINLVWLGGIITFIGSLISMWKRAQENKAA
jgi:cytochrome c-type biogenesis protein CcmF